MQVFLHFRHIFAIFDDFSELYSTFGTLYFEKSSNTEFFYQKMKKNLPIITSNTFKWQLLEPKMSTVHCIMCAFLPLIYIHHHNVFFFLLQSASNGVSKSVLRYEPTIEDDGRYLTCRAENAALRNTALEDQWTIQVHCKQLYCFYRPISKIK